MTANYLQVVYPLPGADHFDRWYDSLQTMADVCADDWPDESLTCGAVGYDDEGDSHHRRPLTEALDELNVDLYVRWRHGSDPDPNYVELAACFAAGIYP